MPESHNSRVTEGSKSTAFLHKTHKHWGSFVKHPPVYIDNYSIQPFLQIVPRLVIFYLVALYCEHYLVNRLQLNDSLKCSYQPLKAAFLIAYLIFAFGWRIYESGHVARVYEVIWPCNTAMILCSIGCLLSKPLLIGTSLAMVGIDQLMWYIEIVIYVATGKFPIGVAEYISWPQTTLAIKVTTFHHIWFIPFGLWCLRGSYLHPLSYVLGCFLDNILIFGSRFSPCNVWFPITTCMRQLLDEGKAHSIVNESDTHFMDYLNINCAYQMWSDLKLEFLHWMNDYPSVIYHFYVCVNLNVAQLLPYLILQFLSFLLLENTSTQLNTDALVDFLNF